MTSHVSMAGPFGHVEDGVLKGARRARLSFHLRTPKVRRWLLVQFVSVRLPVEEATEDGLFVAAPAPDKKPCGLARLVDEHRMSLGLHTWS